MNARIRCHQMSKERIELRLFRDSCATHVQRYYRGHRQRRRTAAIKLKRFEKQMLQSYQMERRVDRDRRELGTMRSKIMQLYVHERREKRGRILD